jgi:hypothetical protein
MKVSPVEIEVGFSVEARNALKAFKAAKEAEALAKAQKAEAEAILRSVLGEAQVAKIGGVPAFKLVNGSNRHANLNVLADAFPEAYEASVKVTEYDYIKAL